MAKRKKAVVEVPQGDADKREKLIDTAESLGIPRDWCEGVSTERIDLAVTVLAEEFDEVHRHQWLRYVASQDNPAGMLFGFLLPANVCKTIRLQAGREPSQYLIDAFEPSKDRREPMGNYWVYIIVCRDSYRYVGVTTDIDSILEKHKAGTRAFTTRHEPLAVEYYSSIGYMTYKEAQAYEDRATLFARQRWGVDKTTGGLAAQLGI